MLDLGGPGSSVFTHPQKLASSCLDYQSLITNKCPLRRSLAEIFPSIRFVFPTAKLRHSARRDFQFSNSSFAQALKGEEIISQWFDVWDIQEPEKREELMIPGLQESIEQIVDLIMEEAKLVPLERIILGGISQGCATALYMLLYSGLQIGGFIGISSWLPFEQRIDAVRVKSSKDDDGISRHIQQILKMPRERAESLQSRIRALAGKPAHGTGTDEQDTGLMSAQLASKPIVFLSHSRDDETVPFSMGQTLHEKMQEMGFHVVWREYRDGGHWIHSERGVDDVAAFLCDNLGIQRRFS